MLPNSAKGVVQRCAGANIDELALDRMPPQHLLRFLASADDSHSHSLLSRRSRFPTRAAHGSITLLRQSPRAASPRSRSICAAGPFPMFGGGTLGVSFPSRSYRPGNRRDGVRRTSLPDVAEPFPNLCRHHRLPSLLPKLVKASFVVPACHLRCSPSALTPRSLA